MASYTIYANSDDWQAQRTAAAWADARNVTGGSAPVTGQQQLACGGVLSGGNYTCTEALLHFDTTPVTGTVSAASFNIRASSIFGSGDTFEAHEHTWASAAIANAVDGNNLTQDYGPTSVTTTGYKVLTKNILSLASSSTYGLVVFAQRLRTNVAPAGNNRANFYASERAGTTDDPYLAVTATDPSVNIVPVDATHGHTVDVVTITAQSTIAPVDSFHDHFADAATVSLTFSLVAADTTHNHTVDTVIVSNVYSLVAPTDATHGHSADDVTLVLGTINITVFDAFHGGGITGGSKVTAFVF